MKGLAKIPARRDQYIPQVKSFLPICEGEEVALRCSILLVRDMATASMRRCSDEAHGILDQVQRLAVQYAFTAMGIERLRRLRHELVRLVSCANGLESFAYMSDDPESGGNDAGG